MDVPGDLGTRSMNAILQSAGLTQYVTEPTHIRGHMLDLLITRDLHYDYVFNTSAEHDLSSDHPGVISDVLISRPDITIISVLSKPGNLVKSTRKLFELTFLSPWLSINLMTLRLWFRCTAQLFTHSLMPMRLKKRVRYLCDQRHHGILNR